MPILGTLERENFKHAGIQQAFLGLDDQRKREILDGTSISITEEELEHARRFLALVAITGGQHFAIARRSYSLPFMQEKVEFKSQRDIYESQGILPESLRELGTQGSKMEDQIEHIARQISDDNIKAFYKRLVKKKTKGIFS